MKVYELIALLCKMPQNADVYMMQDGEPRVEADIVYESNSQDVMIIGYNEPVYTPDFAPKGHTEGSYWTPRKP